LGSIIGGIANAITIILLNTLYQQLALKLTEWENHRTQSDFDNALIFKIIMFYFVNSYTSLYYIAFFKAKTQFWGVTTLDDGCKSGGVPSLISWGCPDDLTIQLATILGINMIVGQSQEVLVPYIMSKVQLFRFMKATGEQQEEIPQWEQDSKLSDYQGILPEYCEMVIQFGYITLFASAFPLAPLMAVLNNMIEIRTDAFKLLTSYKRPNYKGATDIGIWYEILETFGILAVITNCLLVGFTFDAIADRFPAVHRTFYVLAIIVCMEHGILAAKYFISVAVPDVPGEISKAIMFQKFCKEQIFKKMTGVKDVKTFEEGKDDLNDVDGLIRAKEEEKLNPLGVTLVATSRSDLIDKN